MGKVPVLAATMGLGLNDPGILDVSTDRHTWELLLSAPGEEDTPPSATGPTGTARQLMNPPQTQYTAEVEMRNMGRRSSATWIAPNTATIRDVRERRTAHRRARFSSVCAILIVLNRLLLYS